MVRIIFFFSLLISTSAFAQKVWTLEDCINHAVENNLDIQRTRLQEEVNSNNLNQSKISLAPDLNGSAGYNINFGRSINPVTNEFVEEQVKSSSFGLNSNLTLFNGLRQINTIKQNQLNLASSQFATKDVINNISLSVASAYLQLLMNKEQEKTLLEQVKLSLEQLDQTAVLVEAGTIPEGNVLDVEAQLATDSLNLIQVQNSLALNRLSLMLLLQLDPSEEFQIEDPNLSLVDLNALEILNSEVIYQEALLNQPVIKQTEFDLRSADRDIELAKGLRYPTLSFFANMRTNHSSLASGIVGQDVTLGEQYRFNLSQGLGVGLNIPIFNRWQVNTAVKNARLNFRNIELQQEQTKNQLKNDVYQAQADAKARLATFKASGKNTRALKTRYNYIESSFNLGAANSLDYSTAKTNLTNSEINLLQAKYDYIFSIAVLNFYLGKPITLTTE